ncbi:MAG: tetratricopeptide repeat protein [bacterium]
MSLSKKYRVGLIAGLAMLLLAVATPRILAQTGWDHYQKALQLQQENRQSEAIAELTSAVEKEPENAFYQNALGLAFIDAAKYEEAFKYLKKAVELDPKLAEAQSGLGVCYNAKGDYQNSIESFKQSLALTPAESPDLAILHNNIGQNYYLMKNYDEAEKELRTAISLNDKLLTAYVNLGNVYTERGDFKNAVAYHEKAVELAPDYPLPRNNLAFAYYKLGKYDDAIKQMEEVMKFDPQNEQFKRNYEFLKAEREKQAANTYAEGTLKGLPKEMTLKPKPEGEAPAMAQQPQETPSAAQAPAAAEPAAPTAVASAPAAENNAPQPRMRTQTKPAEKPKPAEPAAKKQPEAKKPRPEPAQVAKQPKAEPVKAAPQPAPAEEAVLLSAANVPERKSADAGSPEYTRKSIKPAPAPEPTKEEAAKIERAKREALAEQRATEFYRAAKYDLKVGDPDNAERNIERALAIYPDNIDFKTVRGMVDEQRGFLHQAAAAYREVLNENPGHSTARNSLGYVDQLLKRPEMAREEFEKAIASDAANGCAAANLGSVKVLLGDCDAGVQLLTKAIELGCLKAGVLNNISICYFEKGDFMNAQELAHRALKLDPHNDTIISNFSFLVDKSGLSFEPIHLPKDTELEPYFRVSGVDAEVPLMSLTPVAPLDFYEVFKSNYHKRTVLVLPFENLPGTERWTPTPAETYTKRLVKSLSESGYFNVVVPEENLAFTTYREKTADAYVQKMLNKYPADIVYIGKIGRQHLTDKVNTRYKGLKKKDYVEGDYPIETRVILVGEKKPLYDDELVGTGFLDGAVSSTLQYSQINDIKSRAFDDYCFRVSNVILDYFHLIKTPVRHDVVKTVYREPGDVVKFWR